MSATEKTVTTWTCDACGKKHDTDGEAREDRALDQWRHVDVKPLEASCGRGYDLCGECVIYTCNLETVCKGAD